MKRCGESASYSNMLIKYPALNYNMYKMFRKSFGAYISSHNKSGDEPELQLTNHSNTLVLICNRNYWWSADDRRKTQTSIPISKLS